MILRVQAGNFAGLRFAAHRGPCMFCGCDVVHLRETVSVAEAFMFEPEPVLSMVNLDRGEVLIEPVHSHHMCPGLLSFLEKNGRSVDQYKRRATKWPARN